MNNCGILQGRLSEPKEGFQETPINWKREFEILPSLGLSHIEWVVTKKGFKSNPIFNQKIEGYSPYISTICCDNLIDTRISEVFFIESQLFPICVAAIENGIKNVTIPLLEDSDVTSNTKLDEFCITITEAKKYFPSLQFFFEIESNWRTSRKIVDLHPDFFLTYDTGNISSLGLDHAEYISNLSDKIHTVHLKDRDANRKTVEPGTGITDFDLIFECLHKKNVNPTFTLQTARGEDGKEIDTISRHLEYFKNKKWKKTYST